MNGNEKREFVEYLGAAMGIGISLEDAARLQELAHKAHKFDENACNYGLTPRQQAASDKVDAEVLSIMAKYPAVNLYIQGDPRGMPIKLNSEDGWGGICPPTF